ncbi:MAG: NAD(P)-binding domain-containing protein [Symbiopectobacterium sp.]
MIITVIGIGNIGSSFVKRFTLAEHQVRVTGRDLNKAQALAAQFSGAHVEPAAVAAQGGTGDSAGDRLR